MTTEHKFAHLLRAIADGKQIQCANEAGVWWDFDEGKHCWPGRYPHIQWRIKPEKKQIYFVIVKTRHGTYHYGNQRQDLVDQWVSSMIAAHDGKLIQSQIIEFEDI